MRGRGEKVWRAAVAVALGIPAAWAITALSSGTLLLAIAGLSIAVLMVAITRFLPVGVIVVAMLLFRVLMDGETDGGGSSADLNISVAVAAIALVLAVGTYLTPGYRARSILLPAIFVIAWTALSTINYGADPVVWREGIRELSILAVAVLSTMLVDRWRRPFFLSNLLLGLVVAPAAAAILQFATRTGAAIGGELRSFGTFSHPNAAAPVFGIAVLLSFVLLDVTGKLRYLVLSAFFAVAVFSTGSLTGFASTVVMLLAYAVLRPGKTGRKVGIVAVTSIVVLAFVLSPLGQERLAEQASFSFDAYGNQDASASSLGWRLYNWSTLLSRLGESPLVGFGLGSTTTGATATGTIPHSEYVRYLFETGILGFSLLLIGIAVLFRHLWRSHRRSGLIVSESLVGVCIIVGLLVHAATANTVLSTVLMYLVALFIAGSLAHTQQETDENGRPSDYSADRSTEVGSRRRRHMYKGVDPVLPARNPASDRRSGRAGRPAAW